MYEYRCRLIRVIDGNTVEADIDLGFNIWTKQKIRLYGVEIAAPHLSNKELVEKQAAILKNILTKEFFVQTLLNKRGKIGRVLGIVFIDTATDRINVNDMLIIGDKAKKYNRE